MSKKEILTLAAIVAAGLGLIELAKDQPEIKAAAEALVAQLKEYGDQPAPKDLSGDLDDANEALADANETIEELKKLLQEAIDAKAEASNEIIGEVDGVKYLVNHGAAGIGSAAEIAQSEVKMRKILAIKGQNVLTEF